ncbi:general stress protein [Gloeocapsopsis dulcis]|uniref:Signal transduction histidine kinase LytS n=1 Tax=Gloeocapsopsis dulcis AAB1 = 1H9 TaxID=1433147 RepID=A0A6N8G2N4_9CHRO|nr:general stress protein [Gloeocapsopsis dulcis]MUL39359.1 signal transduction histidine kinase LytS [Gloeocapsopsis dulcis AAB1 = 1H9]WNN88895.1 signal transduction histidine kinase LytS [Gloeocapsopsis dulcis]
MVNDTKRRAIGVFSSYLDAEQAISELRDRSFPMDRISIIARDEATQDEIAGIDVNDTFDNKAGEGATAGAMTGGVLGGITGLLVGLGSLVVPGVGPVLFAGEVASALTAALAGGAVGTVTGGLLGALLGLGIPEERAKIYNERVAGGGYLVIVDGTTQDIINAESILMNRGIQEFGIYDIPATTGVQTPHPDATTEVTHSTEYSEPITDTIPSEEPNVIIVDRRKQI